MTKHSASMHFLQHRKGPPSEADVTAGTALAESLIDGVATDGLDGLWDSIEVWSQATFGRTDGRHALFPARHMLREVGEMMTDIEAGRADEALTELADVFHLMVDIACRLGYNRQQFTEALRTKFLRNQLRSWKSPDAEGVIEHSSEG